MSSVPLNVRISKALRERLEKQATASGQDLSTVSRMALESAMPGSLASRPGVGPDTAPPDSMQEIGLTGLLQTSGFIYEEFHPALRGDKALQIYTEMQANSPTVQGVLFASDTLMRQVEWTVEPGGNSPEDLKIADHIQSCLDDMSQSWHDTLSEILSMLAYGWSYHEIVYKVRSGGNPLQPGISSRYEDGLIGWRKLPIRAQTTRWRWEFDEAGGIKGMWQAPWGLGGGITAGTMLKAPVFIPIQKALLFRPRSFKNNPEGVSLLRSAYRPWYFSKRIEEMEAVGIERDLAGFPVAYIPAEHIVGKTQTFSDWKKVMRNVRRNEQECLVIPSDRDESGNLAYEVKLLSAGGTRKPMDTEPVVERYERRIAMCMLADFLFLGQGGSGGRSGGSYSLVANRSETFALALGSLLDQVASVFNRHAIPRLCAINGWDLETLPQLRHGDVQLPDIQYLGDVLLKLSQAGMPIFPDVDVENDVRRMIGLPELSDEEVEQRRVTESPGTPGGDPALARAGATQARPQEAPPSPTAQQDAAAGKQELDKVLKELREARQERVVIHQTIEPAPIVKSEAPVVHVAAPQVTVQAPPAP